MRELRVAMAQLNPIVGDLKGNREKVLDTIRQAKARGADVLAFPELMLTGYPPEDLLCRIQFIEDNLRSLDEVVRACTGPMAVIVGFVDRQEDTYNAAAVIQDGRLVGVYRKQMLPNYGVFDENRYFQRSYENCVFTLGEVPFGISICEDIWVPAGPVREQALSGDALMLINVSASPYWAGKPRHRWNMLSTRAADNKTAVVFVNMVGGQDELIFDGGSIIFDSAGEPVAQGPLFEEALVVADCHLESVFHERLRDPRRRGEKTSPDLPELKRYTLPLPIDRSHKENIGTIAMSNLPGQEEEIYEALVLGTRDYVDKNGFEKVLIGLSGGVDSALTAVIASDALGPQRVVTVGMPSKYSSQETRDDTRRVADNLGVQLIWMSIDNIFSAYNEVLDEAIGPREMGITEENIQSRIRGNLLMALSNYYGWLVLTTGNKSEASVGYCTLYGDMAGGLSIVKDVSKTMVYRLCRWRNRKAGKDLIPETILERPPSAELKPDQKDTDSLPEYDMLDMILQAYVEQERPYEDILSLGVDPDIARDVIKKVDLNEYKRRQSAPGLKISPRALGKDRRLPITNHYRIFDGK